jgi:N-carbamoylputrescine amidase
MTDHAPPTFTVAAIQCPLGGGVKDNVERVVAHVRRAKAEGASIILPSELFEGPYFCHQEDGALFDLARPIEGHETLAIFQKLAKELHVVLPVSLFERAGQSFYNSVAMVDADGALLGVYRKSHIPAGPGYQEKFYFRPGDTGFRVWETKAGRVGVGICWDQWFPECARAMTLLGAEVLLYPTAIGTEPHEPDLDTRDPWQRVMVGHAVANSIPVVAANRIGREASQSFYGSSFIADPRGDKVKELDRTAEGVIVHTFDRGELKRRRAAWGFFRDRRPELYEILADDDPTGGDV